MHVRTELADDRPTVQRVVFEAFGRSDESDLVEALRSDPSWIPELSVVALLRGDVVGHALMTRMWVGGQPALALAPVSVVPAARGHGFGEALVQELLERARELREPLIVVLGDPGYYTRFGFGPADDLGVTGPFVGAGHAFQALRLDEVAPQGRATYAAPFGLGS